MYPYIVHKKRCGGLILVDSKKYLLMKITTKASLIEMKHCTKFTVYFLQIWSHLLKKPLTENFIFCAVKYVIGGGCLFDE